jgi:rubrerythrin
MDLREYTLEEVLLAAIKSEIEAKEVYEKVAERVKNALLRDKLKFLAKEEEKHREIFEGIFRNRFPSKKLLLPEKSPVPLPDLKIESQMVKISEIFEMAMKAEKAAHDFYIGIAEYFQDDPDTQKEIYYIASMELGHYKIFEVERDNALKFEDYDIEWPMTHVGP